LIQLSAGFIGVTDVAVVGSKNGGLNDLNELLKRNLVVALNIF
jgi:hypothetical protein